MEVRCFQGDSVTIEKGINLFIKNEKPKIKDHSRYCEVIKENIQELEELDFTAIYRIKSFIAKVESQESKKNDS